MPKRIISLILFASFLAVPLAAEDGPEGAHSEHAESADHKEEHSFDLQALLVHHLMDSVIIEWQPMGTRVYQDEKPEAFAANPYRRYTFKDEQGRLYKYEGGLPLHITRRVSMMFIVAFLMLIIFIPAARKISSNPYRVQGRFANAVEALVQYLRKDIAEANMHHPTPGYVGYIITAFVFIFLSNLLGLFPPFGEMVLMAKQLVTGAHHLGNHPAVGETDPALLMIWPGITVTGDIAVTMSLAGITTLLIWVAGFHYQGYKFIWHVVPAGVPWPLYLLLWPIEFLVGPLAKGFALTIRLLANMTAGHVLLLVIAGFIFKFQTWWMPIVSVTGMTALYVLELLVALLQAFIFTLLSAIFIGLSMHRH
ncbi:MAG: F0F1 ATP synthase subunit A [Leptospiraceae bacterium]|nr:F0F1 ATP synthase subunit A [Leptospiraceae bacterium]